MSKRFIKRSTASAGAAVASPTSVSTDTRPCLNSSAPFLNLLVSSEAIVPYHPAPLAFLGSWIHPSIPSQSYFVLPETVASSFRFGSAFEQVQRTSLRHRILHEIDCLSEDQTAEEFQIEELLPRVWSLTWAPKNCPHACVTATNKKTVGDDEEDGSAAVIQLIDHCLVDVTQNCSSVFVTMKALERALVKKLDATWIPDHPECVSTVAKAKQYLGTMCKPMYAWIQSNPQMWDYQLIPASKHVMVVRRCHSRVAGNGGHGHGSGHQQEPHAAIIGMSNYERDLLFGKEVGWKERYASLTIGDDGRRLMPAKWEDGEGEGIGDLQRDAYVIQQDMAEATAAWVALDQEASSPLWCRLLHNKKQM